MVMISLLDVPCISFQRMKEILAELARDPERLATDLPFFRSRAADIQSAVQQLADRCFSRQQECRQLLRQEPRLLLQLLQVTTAALQQLIAQLDGDDAVCRAVAALADTVAWMLPLIRERPSHNVAPSTPADKSNLYMIRDTGLLSAYTTLAQSAVSFFSAVGTTRPQLLRVDPALSPHDAAVQLMFHKPHLFAAASTALLNLWCEIAGLVPTMDLLQPGNLLLDSALPSAGLAMALARAYAGDSSFSAAVMYPVLHACNLVARAAVSAPDHPALPNYGVLACPDVYELLLLGYAAGMELLHADSEGLSQQPLLPSLRAILGSSNSGGSSSSSSGGSTSASGSRSSRSNMSNVAGPSSGGSSRSTQATSKGSKPGRLAVSPHHQELLHALVGVRQLAGLHERTAAMLLSQMSLFPLAVDNARTARFRDAHRLGEGPFEVSRTTDSAKQAVREGELVPWGLALPLHPAQIELLALAPSFFTNSLPMLQEQLKWLVEGFGQRQRMTCMQHWQQQQPQGSPSLSTVISQAQLCAQSLWQELGPVLLSLCRRHSGEATGEEREEGYCGPLLSPDAEEQDLTPQAVFATFTLELMHSFQWQVADQARTPVVNLGAGVKQNPVLACTVLEAALHAAPAYSGNDPHYAAGTTCYAAGIAIDFLAEHTAERAAAAAAARQEAGRRGQQVEAQGISQPEQQLFCLLVAALKYLQFSAASTSSAPALLSVGVYVNACTLMIASSSAARRMLGEPDASRVHLHALPGLEATAAVPAAAAAAAAYVTMISIEQQLLWFHVLGRALIAAGQLLQQVPERVSASGTFAVLDSRWSMVRQFVNYSAVMQVLVENTMHMHSMLQQGGAAAAAVAAGSSAAAATPADLSRLLQQAADLQQQLMAVHKKFDPSSYDANGNCILSNVHEPLLLLVSQIQAAMQQLHAACTAGGLPQQLRSFGVACCAAFPQRGVCGNGACTNLDRFGETALASQGCSGCGKAVKFCSAACHKTAWKEGHKAACTVLKQRCAAAAPSKA